MRDDDKELILRFAEQERAANVEWAKRAAAAYSIPVDQIPQDSLPPQLIALLRDLDVLGEG